MTIVVKGDGTRETFEVHKLEASLRRAGAKAEEIAVVVKKVGDIIEDGMTTSEIYHAAFKILHKKERTLAARYSMRRALLDMGPTGFPFEDYFAELMRAKGYIAATRQIVQGKCAPHEVDVVLTKGTHTVGAELKFHNVPGFKTDIKTALYVRARFTDIADGAAARGEGNPFSEAWLVTNTKFTEHALSYATCAGIHLMGWSYPGEGNLGDIIYETGLYPITVLTTISKKEEAQLLARQVTLCRDIANDPSLLHGAGIARRKHAAIISESTALCRG